LALLLLPTVDELVLVADGGLRTVARAVLVVAVDGLADFNVDLGSVLAAVLVVPVVVVVLLLLASLLAGRVRLGVASVLARVLEAVVGRALEAVLRVVLVVVDVLDDADFRVLDVLGVVLALLEAGRLAFVPVGLLAPFRSDDVFVVALLTGDDFRGVLGLLDVEAVLPS
jgi:hypothetical protein